MSRKQYLLDISRIGRQTPVNTNALINRTEEFNNELDPRAFKVITAACVYFKITEDELLHVNAQGKHMTKDVRKAVLHVVRYLRHDLEIGNSDTASYLKRSPQIISKLSSEINDSIDNCFDTNLDYADFVDAMYHKLEKQPSKCLTALIGSNVGNSPASNL